MATLEVISSGSGTVDSARLQNTATAADNNGAEVAFAANRTTSGLTNVASVTGVITDITQSAYKGALALLTANNAAPAERMRVDYEGNVGIGTTGPTAPLYVTRTFGSTSTGSLFNVQSEMLVSPSSATASGDRVALRGRVEAPVGNTVQAPDLSGCEGVALNQGSGDVGLLIGNGGYAKHIGSGDTGYLIGLRAQTYVNAPSADGQEGLDIINEALGSSVVPDIYGIYILQSITGSAAVTNRYGIYIDQYVGTTSGDDFGLYVASTMPNYFAGKVGIGTTSPASRLDIGDGALTLQEMTAPSAPASNRCVVYAEDNGSGKTRLMVRFATGSAVQLAIEP